MIKKKLKRALMIQEKNLFQRTLSRLPWRRLCHWGLKEDHITEDLKRILSMKNPKRILITVKPKDNAINGDPQKLQDPQWLLRRKLTFSGFLVMVYDSVGDGKKFQRKIWYWKTSFSCYQSLKKLKLKYFSRTR